MTSALAVSGFVGRTLIARLSLLAVISGLLLIGTFFVASLQLHCPLTHADADTVSTSDPVKVASGELDTESIDLAYSEILISAAPVFGAAPAQQRQSYRSSVEFRWTFEVEGFRTCFGRELVCAQEAIYQLPRPATAACMRRPTLVTLGIRLQA
jgi:hypothetical protein